MQPLFVEDAPSRLVSGCGGRSSSQDAVFPSAQSSPGEKILIPHHPPPTTRGVAAARELLINRQVTDTAIGEVMPL